MIIETDWEADCVLWVTVITWKERPIEREQRMKEDRNERKKGREEKRKWEIFIFIKWNVFLSNAISLVFPRKTWTLLSLNFIIFVVKETFIKLHSVLEQ